MKENPPALYRETNEYFEGVEEGWGRNPPADVRRSGLEEDHGRQENREVLTEEDIGRLNGKGQGKDLRTIVPAQERGKGETHGLQPLLHQQPGVGCGRSGAAPPAKDRRG